jgi:hypothetical protein
MCSLITHMDHFGVCVVPALFSILSSSTLFWPYLNFLPSVLCDFQVKLKEPAKKPGPTPLLGHRRLLGGFARRGLSRLILLGVQASPTAASATERLPGLGRTTTMVVASPPTPGPLGISCSWLGYGWEAGDSSHPLHKLVTAAPRWHAVPASTSGKNSLFL